MELLSSSSQDGPPQLDASHGLVSLLPFLYIAWADGILTPMEQQEIRAHIEQQSWLSEADKGILRGWLDPSHPPSASQYYRWIRAIKQASQHIPDAAELSLAKLGVALTRFVNTGGDGSFSTPEALRALEDIEAVLGIVGTEITRDLLEVRPASPPDEAEAAPAFDVAAMKSVLDGPHEPLRDRIRTLLRDPVFRYRPDLDTAAFREQVWDWTKILADQGLGALAYPKSVGGAGSMEEFIVAFETLAYHDQSLVIKYGVQFGLFGGSIQQLGTKRHHEDYLPEVGAATLPGCFAMSELGHGSNVRELLTTATYEPETDEFIVHTPSDFARKEWIGNAARHGRLASVFAQLVIGEQSYGVHAFLVPLRDESGEVLPNIRIEDCGAKMGLNGVDNGRIWFDRVRIPRANLLDRFATVHPDGSYDSPIPSSSKRFFTMLGTLVGGRISVASAGLSAAKSGLTIAIRYGNRRRQFGPKDEPETPILDYRTHQRRLFPPLANAYALTFALADVRQRFAARHPDEDTRTIEALASGLKAFSSWNTTATLQTARETCGGQGYLIINRIADLKADTDVYTTFEGDNTVLMLQVAKGLLTEFRQEFSDINFFGLVKYVSDKAATALKEQNPVIIRNTDEAHLRDPEFQLAAFRYREQWILQSVAKRLKKRIAGGMDSYDAFIEVQNQLLDLAQASIERAILERFISGLHAIEDETLRPMLKLLCDLFALHHLDQDRGWFQAHGYFESAKARAIHYQIDRLCAEIRPHAGALVDAFAIPDELLAAPIGVKETVS